VEWTDLARDRDRCRAHVNTVIKIFILQNAGNFLSKCTTGGSSRKAQLHVVSYFQTKLSNGGKAESRQLHKHHAQRVEHQ
jgi:hypothetical protein